ncbi:M10 family metallopeptidase, partial [Pseudomonas sp. CCNWLW250]|uniref:M10 family metallopeptidase n=1 Tax=Pseudomonas sp. CCNWLW250 TaxID=3128886 RepID=UPI00307D082B
MPSPLGYSFVSSAKLTGNAQIDSLIYGTYWMGTWSNGAFTTPLTYSFMTTDSLFARFYSDDNEYEAGYVLSSAQQSSIVDALGAWSSVANIKFTQVTETSTNVGDLRFGGYGDMDTGTAAWAYYPSRTPSGGDVWIGPVTNNPAPVEGTYDYLTFMHEIGHALGLKHPFDQGLSNPTVLASQYDDVRYTIMSYDNAYSYEPTTPMLLDIAAIQRLYGANTQWQAGNNTYSWASDQSVFETIWDAGGTDTIDASNQVAAVRINLNEGQFSKIGKTFLDPSDKVFNEGLAIAYGAKIENAVGSAFNDSLIGNALGNVLNGLAGKDSMAGGAGNDTYVVDDAGDIVSETSTLATEIDTVRSSVTWALGANLENLTLSGNSSINGTGNALNNTLIGNDGNNVLNGSAGRDTLIGGAGNDTYVLDQAAELTLLRESVSQGTDSLVIGYAASSASSVVDLNLSNLGSIENVTLSGAGAFSVSGNSLNNSLVGNAAANVLNGQGGADTLDGGAGNDTYYVDNVGDTVIERGASILEVDSVISSISYTLGANLEALTLSGTAGISGTGNGLNNRITGNAGANTLDGGIGIDTLAGGTGNDTYVVDNLKDVVSETSTLASEIDTVRSSVTWTLGANLENLTLTGTAAINGTGNALGNVLTGNAGNNLLNGGAGRDTLIGGAGNDTYVLDQAGELALLQEAADQGTDSLAIGYASSSPGTLVDLTLSNLRNIENVTLSGAGVFTVVGNDQDNRLIGNAAVNTLRGGAGNDYLDGGAGADTLTGGTDDDTYTVDNVGDKVVEAAGEGRDLIRAAVSYTLSTNVEDGQLLGTAALNLVGNALDNSLIGNAAANVLNGQGGADTLDGGAGNDT